jgi:hypothetical protein
MFVRQPELLVFDDLSSALDVGRAAAMGTLATTPDHTTVIAVRIAVCMRGWIIVSSWSDRGAELSHDLLASSASCANCGAPGSLNRLVILEFKYPGAPSSMNS